MSGLLLRTSYGIDLENYTGAAVDEVVVAIHGDLNGNNRIDLPRGRTTSLELVIGVVHGEAKRAGGKNK